MQAPEDVLAFWFDEHGPDDWFAGKPEFDAEIAARFGATHGRVAAGEAYQWRKTAEGRLAEVIVLDQFSRQLFRNTGRAYAFDGMALVLAQEAVAQGLDHKLASPRRNFFYLPYLHSESLIVQAQCRRLYQTLRDDNWMKYSHEHFDVIQRFGRFPKRNVALGRESTLEELAYLASGEHSF